MVLVSLQTPFKRVTATLSFDNLKGVHYKYTAFIPSRFTRNYPSDGKFLSNFQDSIFFHQATITATD